MRGCVTKLVIPLVLVGLFSYLVLPGLVEDQIAQRLQESTGALTRPEVEVSSSFPPEMLLGRIDRVQVSMDQMSLQGVAFYDARVDLGGVSVSVPSLLEGSPRIETRSCSLGASAPAVQIDENQACLGYLGLGPV
ncbi:MAG: LmeA family phospholipid-binding protein [Rubrobacter sp.]|nr:LmeA family phospholipid-binding protein [Rubrobacter sp.]